MQSLERIAKVRELASQELVVPSKWSLEVCDAAEAWAKLVAMLDVGCFRMKRPGYAPHEVFCELNWDYGWAVVRKETPEDAVAALFDRIGAADEQS